MKDKIKNIYEQINVSKEVEENLKKNIYENVEKEVLNNNSRDFTFNIELNKDNKIKCSKKRLIIVAIMLVILFVGGVGVIERQYQNTLKDKENNKEKNIKEKSYNGYISFIEYENSILKDSKKIILKDEAVIGNMAETIYDIIDVNNLEFGDSSYADNLMECSVVIGRKKVNDGTVIEETDRIRFYNGYLVINDKVYSVPDYNKVFKEIAKEFQDYVIIERNLEIISSISVGSNVHDYIYMHQREFDDILKIGNKALNYMLYEIERSDKNGLRESVMMELCIKLMGDKNNVAKEDYASPKEWYEKLDKTVMGIRTLPEFIPHTDMEIEQLVYDAALNYKRSQEYLIAGYPKIIDYFETENNIIIFSYITSIKIECYGDMLYEKERETVVAKVIYEKYDNYSGKYLLREYLEWDYKKESDENLKKMCKGFESVENIIVSREVEEDDNIIQGELLNILLRYLSDYQLNISGAYLQGVYYPLKKINNIRYEYIYSAMSGHYDEDNKEDILLLCMGVDSNYNRIIIIFGNGEQYIFDCEYDDYKVSIEDVQTGDIDHDGKKEIVILERYLSGGYGRGVLKILKLQGDKYKVISSRKEDERGYKFDVHAEDKLLWVMKNKENNISLKFDISSLYNFDKNFKNELDDSWELNKNNPEKITGYSNRDFIFNMKIVEKSGKDYVVTKQYILDAQDRLLGYGVLTIEYNDRGESSLMSVEFEELGE